MERRLGEGSPCELVVIKLGDVWGALKTTQYNAEARLQSHNQAEPFDTVFFDTDTILILPRSENSILILY